MNRFTSTKLLVVFGGFLVALALSSTVSSVTTVRAQEDVSDPISDTGLIVAVPDPGPQSPQDVYLDLVKQKVKLMTPDQLNEATMQLRREFTELQANQKLREVQTQLRNIVQEYPNSSAAVWAKQMLDASPAGDGVQLVPHPYSAPTFDPTNSVDERRAPLRPTNSRDEYVPARSPRRNN